MDTKTLDLFLLNCLHLGYTVTLTSLTDKAAYITLTQQGGEELPSFSDFLADRDAIWHNVWIKETRTNQIIIMRDGVSLEDFCAEILPYRK